MRRSEGAACATLILCLLVSHRAPANAATTHRFSSSRGRLRSHWLAAMPPQRRGGGVRFAVPGWTNAQTRYWLDNATVSAGLG
jgi:hypothetical protein